MIQIVLASGSPARYQVLKNAGFQIKVLIPGIDEKIMGRMSPDELVLNLARMKAAHVLEKHGDEIGDRPLLAADTLGDLDGMTLKKPVDREDAFRTLAAMRGRCHKVITGFSVHYRGLVQNDICVTNVFMRSYSDDEINFYLDSGEWENKAGAYAIQGHAAAFISATNGSYTNVVGLDVAAAAAMLIGLGYVQK